MNFALSRPAALVLCLLGLAPALSAAPKIGVLLKGRSDFWSAVEKGAVDAGAKLGADVIVKALLQEIDVAVQIRLLEALGAQGIQALVIAPCNQDTLAGPVAALAAKGVKIVVVDRLCCFRRHHPSWASNPRRRRGRRPLPGRPDRRE